MNESTVASDGKLTAGSFVAVEAAGFSAVFAFVEVCATARPQVSNKIRTALKELRMISFQLKLRISFPTGLFSTVEERRFSAA
jgi:hypothetical protein